ncbi:MAG: serine hydroxymethyltransferase [Deltaproteobacteria bacterium]|nr:serine hydroxymethyltransferase [Candidatus Anaeroferrophillacea bacterium]
MVEAWLAAVFAGGRHARRLAQINPGKPAPAAGAPTAAKSGRRNESIARVDPEIYRLIRDETRREEEKLVMIASENYVSRAVLEAQGSILTNKYAEGYPFKRYYGGCQYVDRIEQLAIDRAKELFGADHVNVQPLSGSAANMAVFHSMLNPGDTILGMSLAHGGHLTHGAPVSFSGQLYRSVSYGVNRSSHLLDYDEISAIAHRERPKIIIAGASSYSRTIDFARFREIADEVDALLMVDMAHIAGLVAAGAHPSPVPHADFVTTTTHKTLRGPRGGMIICRGEFAARVDKAIFPGLQGGPLMHVIAAKAVAFREAMGDDFRRVQHQTVANARRLAGALSDHGFNIISGGTDNHLLLLNLADLGVSGREAESVLDDAGITINKNGIPFDTRPPADPGGIRIGTPIVSTRGMGETEMEWIADFFTTILRRPRDADKRREVREQVAELCRRFPVYRDLLSG